MIVDGGATPPRRHVDEDRPVLVGNAGEVATRPETAGAAFPASSMENRAQAAHPAGAAIPPLLSSTGGGDRSKFQPVAASRDPNVDEDGHQFRERAVACRLCGRKTWAYSATCERCAS